MAAGKCAAVKNAIYRALTQLDGYGCIHQDILLPDYDAATVPWAKMMEGSLDEITSRFERSVLSPALSQLSQHAQTRKTSRRFTYHDPE
ncbi:hypothetical protein ACLK1T_28925 [Escherichia coli]